MIEKQPGIEITTEVDLDAGPPFHHLEDRRAGLAGPQRLVLVQSFLAPPLLEEHLSSAFRPQFLQRTPYVAHALAGNMIRDGARRLVFLHMHRTALAVA